MAESVLKNSLFRFIFIIGAFLIAPVSGYAQLTLYQDVFHGGVVTGGFSTSMGAGNGIVDLYIESGSTIRKAYLFAFSTFNADEELFINDFSFEFNNTNKVASYSHTQVYFSPVNFHAIDITSWLQSNFPDSFNFEVPIQPGMPYEGVFAPFIFIAYDNPTLSPVNVSLICNNQDLIGNEEYNISSLNPFDIQFPVGFSLYTDRSSGLSVDKEVFFNTNLLGIVGGSDNVNWQWNGAGVKGHFYYQENQLYGLDDDIANNLMSGTDGLADVSEYLENNATSCTFQMRHINYPNQAVTATNINLAYTLAYTTPCLPFETTLTEDVTICRGDTAHLLATGGSADLPNAYEWLPQEDLSCYNCPNPVFEGDSSKVYTVRIWNTDSCSKVLPVKVNVLDVPTSATITTTTATCGLEDGGVSFSNVVGGQPSYQYSLGGSWTENPSANIFQNLSGGEYTLTVKDANGCTFEQDFVIPEENPAGVDFTASTQSGNAPLDVTFTNQSTGITDHEWMIENSSSNEFNLVHTFDSAGTYPVQLIGWHEEPHCADTATTTIVVHPTPPPPPDYSHSIFLPTLHPEEGDFFIETRNVQRVELQMFNAIGQHIFSQNFEVADGKNYFWNGSNHARGYYFYRIKYWDVQGLEYSDRGKVLVMW